MITAIMENSRMQHKAQKSKNNNKPYDQILMSVLSQKKLNAKSKQHHIIKNKTN